MSITVGDIKKGVLHEMREFSNAGEIQGTADIKDYLLSMTPLLNIYQKELATSTYKIKRKFEISHNMPDNQLGVWNEKKVHTGGVDDEYIAVGSKAYSVQISRYATVYIKEETSTNVWETRVTITHTPTAGEGYVTYKGLTGITNVANRIKIVISGDYRYPYRWVALFADSFYNASEVPQYEPYVAYILPSGYYQFDRCEVLGADRQYTDYNEFKLDCTNAEKLIKFDWNVVGEFIVRYYALPTIIVDPDPSNPTALDSTVLEIADECLPTLVHKIASTLSRDENSYMSDIFREDSQISEAKMESNDNYEQGNQGTINNSNW